MNKISRAILAGGCFWGMEELFRKQNGVINTTVGYTGGLSVNPNYANHEGHAEAIEIIFSQEKTSYRDILEFFFKIHDPTTRNRQGNDIGLSYRSAIFYEDQMQYDIAKSLIDAIDASKKWPGKIVTELNRFNVFYPAENYHQDYLQKNPDGYSCHYVRHDWRL